MQKKLLVAGLVATSLILSTATIATATTNTNNQSNSSFHQNKDFPGTMGTISTINGNSITIAIRERGSETETNKTITVSESTKYTKDRETSITLSDLASGQRIIAKGTKDSSGNIAATSINVETKAFEFKNLPQYSIQQNS